jgi:hypothetical protein
MTEPAQGERALLEAEVTEHLAKLPWKVRFPVVLHFFEGQTYDDIALVVGAPKPTIQSRIRSGLERLRESLAGAGCALTATELERWFAGARAAQDALTIPAPSDVAVIEAGARSLLASLSLPASLGALAIATGLAALGVVALVRNDKAPPSRASARVPESPRSPESGRATTTTESKLARDVPTPRAPTTSTPPPPPSREGAVTQRNEEEDMKKKDLVKASLMAVGLLGSSVIAAAPTETKPPTGWFLSGSHPGDYEATVDLTTSREGRASARFRSKEGKAEIKGFGTLMQSVSAGEHKAKRVRLSALVKSENVTDWAGLWMRVDGRGVPPLAFDNMQGRPIKGTSGWAPHEIVLDVPEGAEGIALGILLAGTGTVWVDDWKLAVVPASVPVTGSEQGMSREPENLGLEDDAEGGKPRGWGLDGNPAHYEAALDTRIVHGGRASAVVRSKSKDATACVLGTGFSAESYKGKRVRVSAWLRAEDVASSAGLVACVPGSENPSAFLERDYQLKGTTNWTRCETELDVPAQASVIALCVVLKGTGAVWIDDCALEVVPTPPAQQAPPAPPAKPAAGPALEPRNLDFSEQGSQACPSGWFLAGSAPKSYDVGVADKASRSGGRAAFLRSKGADEIAGFGTLMQECSPERFRGQRVRLSAWVKSEKVEQRAGLWLRVDGEKGGQPLAFDNMHDRQIKGTTDWRHYEVVLEVPQAAVGLAYGILLGGTGAIWIEDVRLELVTPAFPETDLMKKNPERAGLRNPGFEERE